MHCQKIILPCLLIIASHSCLGQIADNFSDGDFAANPAWSGDQARFTVSTGKLKLQAPLAADAAYLSTPSQAIHLASWEFYLQMDFTPSSANYAKVYLVSDQPGLGGPLNGYFIKAGNTAREVSLYRQSGSSEVRIIDGLDDRLNVPLVKARIKVTRDAAGTWQLYSDAGAVGSYASEGTVTDNTHTASSFFGIQCSYTSTRSDKFWFDDFVVSGTTVPDQTPPSVERVIVVNQQLVQLQFSEMIERTTSEVVSNYAMGTLGTPVAAVLQPDDRTVQLQFASTLSNGILYLLKVTGVKDLAGNRMLETNVDVMFFQPAPTKHKDVILTEIFPDPSPQVGLPSAEYVEIYNRSTNPIDLAGWELSDGSSRAVFPAQIIRPGEYWIVTSSSWSYLFSSVGKTTGLVNFPTLNNSSDNLVLETPEHKTIDSVSYSLVDYHDSDKEEGGWALEIIDPENTCAEQENWTASEDPKGGTPGRQNSVLANKPDLTGPTLLSVFAETETLVTLSYNEKLDQTTWPQFSIHEAVSIKRVSFKDHRLRTLQLELGERLVRRQRYTIDISGIRDCSENEGAAVSWSFGLPELPVRLDLVINEILFNPRPGGEDFVEIFNRSEKYLDLKNMKICNVKDGIPINRVTPFPDHRLLAPGGFLVFNADPIALKQQYPQAIEQNLHSISLPSLPDDSGSVGILDEQGMVVDELTYEKAWHSKFIRNEEGVSLERITAEAITNDSDNWISASSLAGFATPGFRNSQYMDDGGINQPEVSVVPEIFSPGDGNGFVEIKYNLDQAGWVANVKIMDHQGHQLKTIASNETIGPEGFFRWDGDRDDGNRARSGYYLVWFEIFTSHGQVKTYRKRVVVAAHE